MGRCGNTAALLVLGLGLSAVAEAVTLNLQSESEPYAGVTLRHYSSSGPSAKLWVALVDLCSDYVHVDATYAPTSLRTTGGWASSRGVQLASNGDFYKSGPVRTYGNAVGRGVPWPLDQTGNDPGYAYEWYYQKYGWIAFGHDWVEFSHTKWVKQNRSVADGWEPGSVTKTIPSGTLALVSGFSELVVEGEKVTCPSPTDASCFPDRSDMRARHPRTAMGLSEDRQTFILLVVDGRTSQSSGMYGVELADVMHQLGAYVAFNLDGGGSSQLWLEGEGYLNNHSGNNGGNGARAVANHWGVFAGSSSGQPRRPGHCVSRAPCQRIAAAGGLIDDDSACFKAFGPSEYWRHESAGHGGSLLWTNAWQNEIPSNWAWWQLDVVEAGDYLVEIYAEPGFAVYDAAPYRVRAGGQTHALVVDQSAGGGWQELGTFQFDAGGEQFVRVDDNSAEAVASGQHIAADALRLTRIGGWCGDGACDDGEDCEICAADCGSCQPAEADAGVSENVDAGVAENADAGVAENVDAGVAENVDAGVAENVDAGVAENADAGGPGGADAGAPEDTDAGAPENSQGGAQSVELGAGGLGCRAGEGEVGGLVAGLVLLVLLPRRRYPR